MHATIQNQRHVIVEVRVQTQAYIHSIVRPTIGDVGMPKQNRSTHTHTHMIYLFHNNYVMVIVCLESKCSSVCVCEYVVYIHNNNSGNNKCYYQFYPRTDGCCGGCNNNFYFILFFIPFFLVLSLSLSSSFCVLLFCMFCFHTFHAFILIYTRIYTLLPKLMFFILLVVWRCCFFFSVLHLILVFGVSCGLYECVCVCVFIDLLFCAAALFDRWWIFVS